MERKYSIINWQAKVQPRLNVYRTIKRIFCCLLTMVVIFSSFVLIASADSAVIDAGQVNGINTLKLTAEEGVSGRFDMFGSNTKNLMPGNNKTLYFVLKNTSNEALTYSMKAGITSEETYNSYKGQERDNVDYQLSLDLIHKIQMKLYCFAEDGSEIVIYQGSADGTTVSNSAEGAGDFSKYTEIGIGKLGAGHQAQVYCDVQVPWELDNTYANAVGMVDWYFKAFSGNSGGNGGGSGGGSGDNDNPGRTDQTDTAGEEVNLVDEGVPLSDLPSVEIPEDQTEVDIPDEEIPLSDVLVLETPPKTGDTSPVLLFTGLAVVSLLLLIILFVVYIIKKKEKDKAN